ncbi:MAG: hypothetical protein QM762_21300 [Chryseolinea sp.]
MRSAIVILCVALLMMSCRKNNANDEVIEVADPIRRAELNRFDEKLLQGVWWLNEADPFALFSVVADSLYYTEAQDAPYHVKISSDTLMMSQKGVQFKFILKLLSTDSLVLYDNKTKEFTRLRRGN